jgi:hypothetical protein
MASYSDKRQLRPAPSDHDDDAREAPPPTKRMKQQDGSGTAAASNAAATTATTATNSFAALSVATFFPPVTAAMFGATVVGNGMLGYPLGLQNERIAGTVQTKRHHSGSGSGSGSNNNITYWSSPLAKTMSPPSRALHYYEA